ncbi:SDR family oxidoreductase [uncultured Mailhella sp.]|uniref:SDR family NAD(P)-dependent oxidoreductase n=1 Tax=uncultured Mailhella sp. TaxID=1981031 RepID=UPI00260FAF1B|nr:SDR family oxidoreductase [uncultured Mailhella sp.]
MLEGKTAFITGTNRGIGKALVTEFARNGADVVAHARRDTPDFREWCAALASEHGVTVTPVFFDLTDSEAMKTALRSLISSKVPVDILVNNAGVAHGCLFQMTGMARIREIFDINLFAMMELTQFLLRYMLRRGQGSIINLGSVLGLDMPAGSCAYGLSKAAVMAFTRTLASECGPLGVRVNAVAPGLVATEMADQMERKAEESMMAQCAMKRRALPEEVARTVVFLASEEASFINGQILRIDGGKV